MRRQGEQLERACRQLTGAGDDYDELIERIGDARLVLLGEASHGTREFYRERARITRRLIEEKGFAGVAAEADWPDAHRVNRYVQGTREDRTALESLGDFQRFPSWMWRNQEVLEFVEWLAELNLGRAPEQRAGFYGLDLYSLNASMSAVVSYLERTDPDAAAAARQRYACFDSFDRDSQRYGLAALSGLRSCEDQVVAQLREMQQHEFERIGSSRSVDWEGSFYAEQNARVVANAEEYYRTMFKSDVSSWNLRDQHMSQTLSALEEYLGAQQRPSKLVVWAHNSHIGDARSTEMGERGELNLGQLTREEAGREACLVGFTTATGWVSAASDWDAEVERKRVREPLPGSYEMLFRETGMPAFWLSTEEARDSLLPPHLERAIGVVYRPETERWSHYFSADMPGQFDFVLHFDETEAVEPLEKTAVWSVGEAPETYPSRL